MENSKDIIITDCGNEIHLRMYLFGVEKGLDFVDTLAKVMRTKDFSIKLFLNDLLPLVALLDANGEQIVKQNLTVKDCYGLFRNPLAVLDLATQVLEFQMVFLEDSKTFQPLARQLRGILATKISESETA